MKYHLALCIDHQGHAGSLQMFKIYRVLPWKPEDGKMLRVIDESGEDYLYPRKCFIMDPVKPSVRKAILSRMKRTKRIMRGPFSPIKLKKPLAMAEIIKIVRAGRT